MDIKRNKLYFIIANLDLKKRSIIKLASYFEAISS